MIDLIFLVIRIVAVVLVAILQVWGYNKLRWLGVIGMCGAALLINYFYWKQEAANLIASDLMGNRFMAAGLGLSLFQSFFAGVLVVGTIAAGARIFMRRNS